jgi:hypothetical protein
MGNVEDVRISSIIGYPTSCTTFVPFPSPMNSSCFGLVFARLPVRKRCGVCIRSHTRMVLL